MESSVTQHVLAHMKQLIAALTQQHLSDDGPLVGRSVVQWRPALSIGLVSVLADGDEVLHSLLIAVPVEVCAPAHDQARHCNAELIWRQKP